MIKTSDHYLKKVPFVLLMSVTSDRILNVSTSASEESAFCHDFDDLLLRSSKLLSLEKLATKLKYMSSFFLRDRFFFLFFTLKKYIFSFVFHPEIFSSIPRVSIRTNPSSGSIFQPPYFLYTHILLFILFTHMPLFLFLCICVFVFMLCFVCDYIVRRYVPNIIRPGMKAASESTHLLCRVCSSYQTIRPIWPVSVYLASISDKNARTANDGPLSRLTLTESRQRLK